MINEITKKIDALPPLPKTLIELQDFKRDNRQDITQLLGILDKDPLIMATLLKVANSAMFGFRNKVETTKKAVELIGVNFTLSIAFGSAIKSSLNTDLSPYGINTDKFLELSSLGTNLLNKWLKTIDPKLLSELLLPVFLQDAGEFIISDLAHEKKENEKFFATIQKDHTNIDTIEKEFFGATSSDITAMIFKRWKLDDNLVKYIENISSLEPKEDESLNHSQVLQIISILANPIEPLSDASIEKANQLASVYKLNTRHLNKAIETMQDRILDA